MSLTFLWCCILVFIGSSAALEYLGDRETYAKFPEWNACPNASISFEFKTRQEDGLLMYTDDNGRYDYLQVAITDGSVRLWANFVQDKEQTVEIELGRNLNDGRWHRVEVKRNRMETILLVDSNQSSKVAVGSDRDSRIEDNNSHVYFGGVPNNYLANLRRLNIPEDIYRSKFSGEMRNVLYFNCSCIPERASHIEGRGIRDLYKEACDVRNPCHKDCPCISADDGSGCACSYRQECIKDLLASYSIPMDAIVRDLIVNPSGLDARVYGGPQLVDGVRGKALLIHGDRQKLRLSGPSHKTECLGDLDRCEKGYFIGMWFKFDNRSDSADQTIYMSNGGHRRTGHGISMAYGKDGLDFVFKTKDGKVWTVKDKTHVHPDLWTHVAASWEKDNGAFLYINGRKVDHDRSPSQSTPAKEDDQFEDFVIGQSNDQTGPTGTVVVDDFSYESSFKDETNAMDAGAATHLYIPMDRSSGDKLDMVGGVATLVGRPRMIEGKIGKTLSLTGNGEYVDLGNTEGKCLGYLDECVHGFYISFFIKFPRLDNHHGYVYSSPEGISIYQTSSNLVATAQRSRGMWETRYSNLHPDKWYFVEVSWTPDHGLALYVNQREVSKQGRETYSRTFTPSTEKKVFFGRSNDGSRRGFVRADVDEVDIFYAGREMLSDLGYIMRDTPMHYHFDFDNKRGDRLVHDNINIYLGGDPRQVDGKVRKAIQLDGNGEFIDFGDQSGSCFGNLDHCHHGVLYTFWMRPDSLKDNVHILSSGDNGISLHYRGRRLRAMAETSSHKWDASSSADLDKDKWHFVEVSFHPIKGLSLFVNNKLVAEDMDSETRTRPKARSSNMNRVYLGRGNIDARREDFAAATFDDMDVWLADRSYLIAHDFIQRYKPKHFIIKFERLVGDNRLYHPELSIALAGRPRLIPGKVNNALALQGRRQYADLGRRGDECMSNLIACKQGITIAAWMRFHRFQNNMVYLSSGENGILMKYLAGYIQVSADGRGIITVPDIETERWYFIEITWDPETGLKVYKDNQLVGQSERNHVERAVDRGSFYIGTKNHGDIPNERASTGFFDIDEMEIWYGKRDNLVAFDYIDRDLQDNLGYEAFAFDSANGRRITHNKYAVVLVNQASIGPGRFGKAVHLDGNRQYVDLGQHYDKCFGNLDYCSHGLTLSMWLYPNDLRDGTTFLSTPTYNLFYEDGRLNSVFQGKDTSWATSSTLLSKDEWQRITLAWHPKKGLTMYINDELVGQDRRGSEGISRGRPESEHIYIGRPLESDDFTANMKADELQVWYDDLDQLRATGQYRVQVVPRDITFDEWNNNRIRIRDRYIEGHGDIRSIQGKGAGTKAIYLPGVNSYLDLGQNFTCGGDLDTCRQGATVRLGLRPFQLRDGMVFLDSWPVKLYYENGRLHGQLQTADQLWKVDTRDFVNNKWQRVELTWHPRNGLALYVEGRRVDYQIHPVDQTSPVPDDWRTYFGRALKGGRTYANTAVDSIEFWQAYRDFLPEDKYLKIPVAQRPTTPRPTYRPKVVPEDSNTFLVGEIVETREIHHAVTVPKVELVTAVPVTRKQPVDDEDIPTQTVKTIYFKGDSAVKFNLGRLQPVYLRKAETGEFQFYFLTEQPNGVLWSHEERGRKMYLALLDGHLMFVNDDGSGSPDVIHIGKREGARFDDKVWHQFKVERKGKRVMLTVDGRYPQEYIFSRDVQFLSPAEVHLGGPYLSIDGRVIPNYKGGMALILYKTETYEGNRVFKNTVNLIAKLGGIVPIFTTKWPITRPTTPRPRPPPLTSITMKEEGLYLNTRGTFRARNDSSISLKFRTIKKNGLLLYSTTNLYGRNFFAMELYDGKLYFIHNFGGKTHRTLMSSGDVADGQQHEVNLQFYDRFLTMRLDGEYQRISLKSGERLPRGLSNLFIGGYNDYNRLPWHTWARESYQGCLEDVQISGQVADLRNIVPNLQLYGRVEEGCLAMPRQCSALNPCGPGQCTNLWGGYKCNCQGTDFRGEKCNLPAWTALFNNSYNYKMSFTPQQSYHVNDISLRFKGLTQDGLIFQTRARNDGVFMRAELKDGRVLVTTNLGGKQQVLSVGENLNDHRWHTLNIRRRGNQLETWVDTDDQHDEVLLPGNGYYLTVDDVFIGGDIAGELVKPDDIPNFIGYIRNFYMGGVDVFDKIHWDVTRPLYTDPIPAIIVQGVTFPSYDDHVKLRPMKSASDMNIHFMFKTTDDNGVIMLNEGLAGELFVVELFDKRLRLKVQIPNKVPLTMTTPKSTVLSDGKWHSVSISHDYIRGQKQVNMAVDGLYSSVGYSGIDLIDLRGPLYVGGLPLDLFKNDNIKQHVMSKTGFRGCLASFDLGRSRGLQNLYEKGLEQSVRVLDKCQEIRTQCTPTTCKNGGICHDHLNNGTTWCDCSMTALAGPLCEDEPLGYYFGNEGKRGLLGALMYRYPTSQYTDNDRDEIVLGVMTKTKNGVLTKLLSDVFKDDFIQLKLVNGYVVADYGTNGDGTFASVTNSEINVSDGKYHIIRFIRTAKNGTLYVDGGMTLNNHITDHGKFDRLSKIFVGGVLQAGKLVKGTGTRGIVGGLNVNGQLILPFAEKNIRTDFYDDVIVAPHPFKLGVVEAIATTPKWVVTTPWVVTSKPIDPTIKPPVTPFVIPVIPDGVGGGGIAWTGLGGVGNPGPDGTNVVVYPDGGSGSVGNVPGGLPGNAGPAKVSQIAAVPALPTSGPRAGAVMGTLLGLAVLASSIMWAFYKCKPGMCPCCAAGGKGPMAISAPRAASNMGAVQAATAAGAGSGAGAGALTTADGMAAGGGDMTDAPIGGYATGIIQSNGISRLAASAGSGGGGGGGASGYYSQHSTSSSHQRQDSYDSATLRAMGTFSNKGTAIGTPKPARAQFGSTASASGYSLSDANQSYHFEGNSTADYDVATGVHANANYQSNTLNAGGGGFSSATMSSNYNYSVKTIKTVGGMSYGGSTSNIIVTPGAMGEEVRVDCCLMTNDGHSVVTGSSLGPPQVWTMNSGELLRIMQGETVGSTFLHLVNGDRLLVGAINSDLEINQYSVPKGVHNYVFQIWDFASGRPLDMAEQETCSALSVMKDSDRVLFGRSDKFGGGTNIVIWDLLGNQPVKEMRYDAPVGNNDYISYVSLSQNDRYVVTGFTNTFDNFAEFVIFDMNTSSYNVADPNILRLDALPEVTAILPRDEAITGLRNGDLVVWSLVTGQPSRQLLSSNGKHAHLREVKAVARSMDNRYLVSASADGTLKLWDLETERQLTTMSGHNDEVWCCAISEDNEIVVSGSRDGTIRLWRLRNGQEICSFNAGVDVFYITMSRDKGTIVALGDKFGARKLVMLQVVRSKVKRQVLA